MNAARNENAPNESRSNETALNDRTRNKNRLVLLAIALLFGLPVLLAVLFNSNGWRPQNTRNHGTLVQPPQDMTATRVTLADGSAFAWTDVQRQWTLLAVPGVQCGENCRTRLDEILRMRITLGRNAERVRVLYLGAPLDKDYVAARAPLLAGSVQGDSLGQYRALANDGLALALVDPNGLLMMRYAEGYIAYGVREDIVRVLH